jgi:hypothetical protein
MYFFVIIAVMYVHCVVIIVVIYVHCVVIITVCRTEHNFVPDGSGSWYLPSLCGRSNTGRY